MSRTRLLLATVIVLALLAGGTVIARIWGVAFADDITTAKLLISYLVAGLMAAFGVIILVDYQGHRMKRLLMTMLVLAEFLGLLTLLQIWGEPVEWWTFAKLAGSIIVAGALIGFIMAAIEDFDEDKDLKKKNYLD